MSDTLGLETARVAIDEQFKISERIDAKARNHIATAGAFAALSQAVGASVLQNVDLSKHQVVLLGTLGGGSDRRCSDRDHRHPSGMVASRREVAAPRPTRRHARPRNGR